MAKTILIVEDSLTVRHQLRTLLHGGRYDLFEAGTGNQGLAEARARAFDLIISDVNMPGMNGIDMVHAIRQLAGHHETPIFMLTTESSAETITRGKEAGVTAWIRKPFKPELLLMGIHKITGA